MRRAILLSSVLFLSACQSEVEKAKANVEFVERHNGTHEQMCEAKTKLADAYRDARDDQHYDMADIEAQMACNQVRIDNLG